MLTFDARNAPPAWVPSDVFFSSTSICTLTLVLSTPASLTMHSLCGWFFQRKRLSINMLHYNLLLNHSLFKVQNNKRLLSHLTTVSIPTHTHNRSTALWNLSGKTRVSRYQKKHSPTTLIVVINHPYQLSPSSTNHGILPICTVSIPSQMQLVI